MPRPTFVNCAFDPNQCPLLQGLTPEEQREQIAANPLIRACISGVNAGAPYPEECSGKKPRGGSRPAPRKIPEGA